MEDQEKFKLSFPSPDTVFCIMGLSVSAFFILISLWALPSVVEKYLPSQKSSMSPPIRR